jgi:hypothetical protein
VCFCDVVVCNASEINFTLLTILVELDFCRCLGLLSRLKALIKYEMHPDSLATCLNGR